MKKILYSIIKYFVLFIINIRDFCAFILCNNYCVKCGKKTDGLPFCKECLSNFLLHDNERIRCKICGRELLSEKKICSSCKENGKKHLENIFPLYPYHLYGKEMLFYWKMKEYRQFSFIFAKQCFEAWKLRYDGLPIVPVPPRPGKIKKKGWDQIDEITFFLTVLFNVPVLKLLKRISTVQQKKKNRLQRLDRTKKSYVLKSKKELPDTVVLLDDVMTTGATLNECADILSKNGVKKVYGLTLFYVD